MEGFGFCFPGNKVKLFMFCSCWLLIRATGIIRRLALGGYPKGIYIYYTFQETTMATYNSLTVPQLKEKLVERNLPVDGLKQDLINRLKANDEEQPTAEETPAASTDAPVETVETAVTEETTQVADAAVPATTATAAATATSTTEETTTEETAASPVPASDATATVTATTEESTIPSGPRAPETKPLPTPEELKKLALDHLNKKLHRANKFGAEQPIIDEINRSINRVEKFGLDLQNPLAIELGVVKKPTPPPQQRAKKANKNRKSNDNRNRVRKGGNNSNNNRRGGRRH